MLVSTVAKELDAFDLSISYWFSCISKIGIWIQLSLVLIQPTVEGANITKSVVPIWLHSKLYCCFANIDLGLSRPTQQTIYSEHQPLTVIHLEAWANCCVHQHCCVASIGSNVLPDQRVGCTEFIESHHVIHCVLPQCILYHSPAQWNLWLHIIGHSVCVPYTISYGTLLHAYLDWHGAFPNISNSLHLSMGCTFLKFPMKITCEYCPILLMISNTFLP